MQSEKGAIESQLIGTVTRARAMYLADEWLTTHRRAFDIEIWAQKYCRGQRLNDGSYEVIVEFQSSVGPFRLGSIIVGPDGAIRGVTRKLQIAAAVAGGPAVVEVPDMETTEAVTARRATIDRLDALLEGRGGPA